ncbi:hypothetical protein Tsubulata_044155, partial [Turnera subulata]
MESNTITPQVEMFFFPFVGGGHQIPMIDIARVFASHGAKATIITTPNHSLSFQRSIHRDQNSGLPISIHALKLPDQLDIANTDMSATPSTDTSMLQEPLLSLLLDRKPDCIVHDVGSDLEPFIVPGLPDTIELTRSQLPMFARREPVGGISKWMRKPDVKSMGVMVNSFYELELDYADYFKNQMGNKAWLVGPVSLCNRNVEDKAERGQKTAIDEQAILTWLDSKEPNSVLYISFGSAARLAPEQLMEIAHGLEAANQPFVWVIGKIFKSTEKDQESQETWLPDGFEERMQEAKKGLIIRGWAPQLLILEHVSVGGFLTHCGWNSTLEGVSAGVPMITWPISAEQFISEKLITDVLKIGVKAGNMEWVSWETEPRAAVGRDKVETAVKRLMGGEEEALGMRRRARELGEKAKRAVEKGGSSFKNADALIQELKNMSSEVNQPHILFFPMMAHGHMIPVIDMAKVFASRGLKTTILTTPLNVPLFSKTIERARKNSSLEIHIKTIPFPTAEAGLPEGCENMDFVMSRELGWEMVIKLVMATTILQEPFEKILQECKPDCVVSDMYFHWTTDVAAKYGIPRLVFHGTSSFFLCVAECLRLYGQQIKVLPESEPFVMPNLPGDIEVTRNQIPEPEKLDPYGLGFKELYWKVKKSELVSYGVIVNSFYELEPVYADHYRKSLGRRAWHIGPLSLCNRNIEDKVIRGREASICEHECLSWLNSKEPNSVVYVSFGSFPIFSADQLKELAIGLEASRQQFIWVVNKNKRSEGEEEDWLPEGYEKRIEGRGLIIKGWAPQVLILDHEAVGAFVTHCGWNSTLEGITAGLPLVAWPLGGEQFFNEKMVTQMLKIGISIGVTKFREEVKSKTIQKAITRIIEGEEAEEMRNRAKALGEMARKAVEESGSSHSDLNALIEELKLHREINMGSEVNQPHILFFPMMAHSHMVPVVDMAKLFASRGLKTTIVTTPLNLSFLFKTIERARKNSSLEINIRTLYSNKTKADLAALPKGCENMDFIFSHELGWEMVIKLVGTTNFLQEPFEKILQECKPDYLVTDMFFPWKTDLAAKYGIPRFVFHGTSFFYLCVKECIRLYESELKLLQESQAYVMPDLPGDIEVTRDQIPEPGKLDAFGLEIVDLTRQMREAELVSHGVIVNSFYGLEQVYADHYMKSLGKKAWHIGPLSLCNRNIEDKALRGREAISCKQHQCLSWLNSKEPNSVVYVRFESTTDFGPAQLKEIALGLEASGQQFIWAVRKKDISEDWLPEGYEERIEGRGLLIKGWAPQVLILDHQAVGAFVTHCGWDSTLEGIAAGLPMVAWPLGGEQFFNEKMVTQVLKIGISIGVTKIGEEVESETIQKAITRIIEGEEAEGMRNKAKALGEMSREAVEEGGSSHSDLNSLVEALKLHCQI